MFRFDPNDPNSPSPNSPSPRFAVHALLDLVRKGALILARPWPEHLADAQQIMLKYPTMDAADASLVSLAERSPKADLVTTDRRDFELCRGLRNRRLKLVLPDARNL